MYHGDIRLGDTIDIKFTTRRGDTGAPTTLAGSPVISAYVGNGTTEITAGITLSVDFDSRTGLNNVRVVATSGNGYATATNVQLVITTGTVNSVSVVGEVIGTFSIECRSAVMPTTAARTLDVSAGGEAGVDWANVGSPTTAQNLSGTNIKTDQVVASVSGAVGSVTGAVGSVTGLTASDVGAIKAKTDNLPAAPASTTNITGGTITTVTNLTNAPTAGDLTATMKTSVQTAATASLAAFFTSAAQLVTDVWAATTRLLTAGTNIVLAKGTGVTGFNDLSAAQVNAEADTALADYDAPTHAELTAELATADDAVLAQVALVKAKTDNLPSDPADQSLIIAATDALATLIGDVPTNAELATALAAADDAVLAAIAALNNLSQANIRAAVGLASANLDTQLDALPTNAELATSQAAADDATLAAIAALNNLSSAQTQTACAAALTAFAAAQPTESYAADTAVPTRDQFLFMIYSLLANFAFTGTTQSVKKLDKTTEAMTFALDDETTPTSHTRAA